MENCAGDFLIPESQEFASLLGSEKIEVTQGKIVSGTVVAINKDTVTVDVGYKSEGSIAISQFYDGEGKLQVGVGDAVEVLVLQLENELGQIVLSKEKAFQKRVWEGVENVFRNDLTVSGKVVQKVKGGLQVDIGIPAFLPGSQIDERPHKNLDKFIGQVFEFRVLKMTRDKGNIVLSRRALLVAEKDNLRQETLKVLDEGIVLEGIVKNITDYGAFVDLGGIDGLLHITDICWGRINHPGDKISVGETVKVVVLKFDKDKERVSLGMKQLTPEPWLTVGDRYPVGAVIAGKVMNLTDYGAFLELEEGVEGLIHISEMSWSKKSKHPGKLLKEGEEVKAIVLGVDGEEKRIRLGLKQLTPNPWDELEANYSVGSAITGPVKTIADFGIFIEVTKVIDGLVHISDISWSKQPRDVNELQAQFQKGQEITAVLIGIDRENERLSLSIKALEEDPWVKLSKQYPVGSVLKAKIASIAEFGLFVEIAEGIDGLVHSSQVELKDGQTLQSTYADRIGEEVEVKVKAVDPSQRRFSLTFDLESDVAAEGAAAEEEQGAVTFGDLIRKQISKQ